VENDSPNIFRMDASLCGSTFRPAYGCALEWTCEISCAPRFSWLTLWRYLTGQAWVKAGFRLRCTDPKLREIIDAYVTEKARRWQEQEVAHGNL
jgi:hypothetical protein